MKVTINGVTYEGTEDEIRRIVENPPHLKLEATCCAKGATND